MPSPFLGVDPYLEHPEFWPEVHHRLITAIAIAIAPRMLLGRMRCCKKRDCGEWGIIWVRSLSVPLRVIHGILQGVGIGALIGVGQWVHLQQQLSQTWRWILAGMAIWAIALAFDGSIGGGLR